METKKNYVAPEAEIIEISSTDVICTSCTTDAHGGFCSDDESCLTDL